MNRNVIVRALLASTALIVLAFPAAAVIGGFLPWLPQIGRFGAFLNTVMPTLALLALAALVLVGITLRLGGGKFARLLGIGALAVVIGLVAAGVQLAQLAGSYGATYDPLRQLVPSGPVRSPDQRVVFATIEGQALQADLWLPPAGAPARPAAGRPALVFIHGGAFVKGELGARPFFFDAVAAKGYPVMDIEYRLAPPVRWHDAPADVLCAMAWLGEHAPSLDIDPKRVVLMGDSAGGSLALVAGYAAGTSAIEPSCPGTPVVPAGIVADEPAADLIGIWEDRSLSYDDKPFPETYIGGTPSEFPDRYAAASPFALIRPGLPPTIVIAQSDDQLVRRPRVDSVVAALRAGGVETTLIVLPFAEHGFDGLVDSFGAQFVESFVPAFLAGLP